MIQFEKKILDNGLTVLFMPTPDAQMAIVNILYKVGTRNETLNRTGLAHLFEHIMFCGTPLIPDFDTPIQQAGGENNAFTNNDFTNYYTSVPEQNIDMALLVEADRMQNMQITSKALHVQKKVVVEEFYETTLNVPYGDVWHIIREMAYSNTPYSIPTIGLSPEHIKETSLQEAQDFFHTYYAPNNAILVVSGNFTTNYIFEKVAHYFESIPSSTYSVPPYIMPKWEPAKGDLKEVQKKIPANALYIFFSMERRDEPDYYTADFISDILSGGNSSRLTEKLVKQQSIFSEIDAYILGSMDKGLFIIEAKLYDHISYDEAENAIWKELDALKTTCLQTREFTKVMNKITTYHQFSEVSNLNKVMNLAFFEFVYSADWINKEINKYKKITPEKIQQYALTHFQRSQANILRYMKM